MRPIAGVEKGGGTWNGRSCGSVQQEFLQLVVDLRIVVDP